MNESPGIRPQPRLNPWVWTETKELAARLVADGRPTELEIGSKVGISDRQLRRWKQSAEFRARVEQHVSQYFVELKKDMLRRAKEQIEDLDRLRQSIRARRRRRLR
jgi:hypothetical protein